MKVGFLFFGLLFAYPVFSADRTAPGEGAATKAPGKTFIETRTEPLRLLPRWMREPCAQSPGGSIYVHNEAGKLVRVVSAETRRRWSDGYSSVKSAFTPVEPRASAE